MEIKQSTVCLCCKEHKLDGNVVLVDITQSAYQGALCFVGQLGKQGFKNLSIARQRRHSRTHPLPLFNGDGLGQVTRTVHIVAASTSKMEGEQLQGDDSQDAGETVDARRHAQLPADAELGDLLVVLLANDDGAAGARHHLLQCVLALGVRAIAHADHEHGHVGIDQSQRTVL